MAGKQMCCLCWRSLSSCFGTLMRQLSFKGLCCLLRDCVWVFQNFCRPFLRIQYVSKTFSMRINNGYYSKRQKLISIYDYQISFLIETFTKESIWFSIFHLFDVVLSCFDGDLSILEA